MGVLRVFEGCLEKNRVMKSVRPPPLYEIISQKKISRMMAFLTIYYCPGDISLQKMGPFHPNELAFAEKVLDVFCCTKLDDKSRSSSQSVFC